MRYYICESCGSLTTSDQIDEELSNGGMGYCDCLYMQMQWDNSSQSFEPVYFRHYPEWQEISGLIYKELSKESNTVKRLWMLQTLPNNGLLVSDNSKIKTLQSKLSYYEEA